LSPSFLITLYTGHLFLSRYIHQDGNIEFQRAKVEKIVVTSNPL